MLARGKRVSVGDTSSLESSKRTPTVVQADSGNIVCHLPSDK